MLKTLALLALLTLTLAFKTTQQGPNQLILIESSANMLKFDNFSGPGVHAKQITQFCTFVKEASSLFPSDVSAHVSYLK